MGDSEIKEEIKEQNEPQKEKRRFSEHESRIQTYRLAGQEHSCEGVHRSCCRYSYSGSHHCIVRLCDQDWPG